MKSPKEKQKKRSPKTQEDAEKIYNSKGKKENDYPLIKVWCKFWNKSKEYTNELIKRAIEDNAPNNSVFLDVLGGKVWKTMDNSFNPDLHKLLYQEWSKQK